MAPRLTSRTIELRRVVITGLGIVSSIGNDADAVAAALKAGCSGISFAPEYAEHGFRCHVHGRPEIDVAEHIDKRQLRFMGDGAAYAYLAMSQAIADAGLEPSDVSNERSGLIAGSGGPSTRNMFEAHQTVIEKGSPKRMGPFMVTRCMSSTVSACLATPFKIKGVNYTISSACATSAHCIGHALELIQLGKQDIVFAGGGEELDWSSTIQFDAMGALSTKYNDNPEKASRTYDADRDGFVISGGGGILVVEELEHALARGAHIYAEITGYGATSDGYDMVAPSGEGAVSPGLEGSYPCPNQSRSDVAFDARCESSSSSTKRRLPSSFSAVLRLRATPSAPPPMARRAWRRRLVATTPLPSWTSACRR